MTRVTLTTDFGTRDPYVAELKAELYRRGPPELQVIDLGHEIEPQNVREAALFVAAAVPRFPAGTIHVVVVDPGVGSARRPLCVRAAGQWLVGPDNGVFSLLYDGTEQAFELELAKLRLPPPSATFHGRDLFAPAAAALACGQPARELGSPAPQLAGLPWPQPTQHGRALVGEVIHVDRFGNLITNLERRRLGAATPPTPQPGALRAKLEAWDLPIGTHYAEVDDGALLALWGSSGRLEIAARNANAARLTGASLGQRVRLEPN